MYALEKLIVSYSFGFPFPFPGQARDLHEREQDCRIVHAREPFQEAGGGNSPHHDEVRRARPGGQRAIRRVYCVGQLYL